MCAEISREPRRGQPSIPSSKFPVQPMGNTLHCCPAENLLARRGATTSSTIPGPTRRSTLLDAHPRRSPCQRCRVDLSELRRHHLFTLLPGLWRTAVERTRSDFKVFVRAAAGVTDSFRRPVVSHGPDSGHQARTTSPRPISRDAAGHMSPLSTSFLSPTSSSSSFNCCPDWGC